MAGWNGSKKSYLQQELAAAERQVSELKLQESHLELQVEEFQAQEASEEQELIKVNEAVLRGEELLAETEEAAEPRVDSSEFAQWLRARKDEVDAISRTCNPRRPMLLLEVWMSEQGTWKFLGEQWLPYAEARPQATWTLPLEHLAASRPSPAKHKGDGSELSGKWYLHLSGSRLARTPDFAPEVVEDCHYTMGFEDFVFQLHHLSMANRGFGSSKEPTESTESGEVTVYAWLWGGQMFLAQPPASDSTWNKIFESCTVCLGHGSHGSYGRGGKDYSDYCTTKFADRFSIGLKLHPLYSDPLHSEDVHPPLSNDDLSGQMPGVSMASEMVSFRRSTYDPSPILTTDGRAMVFVDFSDTEFHDVSAKLQIRLFICPCSSGQVLQAVALQAVPCDTVGEKHLTWTWSANSTKLRSFEIERLLTVELRIPRTKQEIGTTGTSTISTAGTVEPPMVPGASSLFPSHAHPDARLYAPQLWLRAAVFQAGEAIAKIDEELLLPVTIARFLQPLNCGEQQLQEYWEEARDSMQTLDIPSKLESLKWCGIRQVEATISCGVFLRQPEVLPPPPRCGSGAAATLMGALLPCPGSTVCCFVAFTGGGGQKLTVTIFCSNEALMKMVVQYLIS